MNISGHGLIIYREACIPMQNLQEMKLTVPPVRVRLRLTAPLKSKSSCTYLAAVDKAVLPSLASKPGLALAVRSAAAASVFPLAAAERRAVLPASS